MARIISWARKERRSRLIALPGPGDPKPVRGLDDLGINLVVGEPLYDNGVYFVVDTVEGVEFAVAGQHPDGRVFCVRRVPLDKYEAFRIADELKDADERAETET